ncbi:MAG: SDR family NAD(P)-dependent oxidoreductase [Myxococcota bacterium]
MEKKTVLITGGNRGLGFYAAKSLANRGWQVVITARDATRGQDAADQIGRGAIALPLDLASLSSIRAFNDALDAVDLPPLHGLICNAGLQLTHLSSRTEDGFESTFGVNHLGHYLFTQRLMPRIQRPGRIIIVSSSAHDPNITTGFPAPEIDTIEALAHPPDDASADPGDAGRRAYTVSKLCNVLFTYELARRVLDAGIDDITVHAYDPGLMPGSGLARDYAPWMQWAWDNIIPVLRHVSEQILLPEESGKILATLMDLRALSEVTGRYYSVGKEVRSSKDSYDVALARRLWEESARLVDLKDDERWNAHLRSVESRLY